MSDIAIDQILSQIRSLSAQAGAGAKSGMQGLSQLQQLASAAGGAGTVAGAPQDQSSGFAQMLKQGIDSVNASQQSADNLASAWERGAPGVDLAQVMIQTQKASVSFQALAQVRNRLVSVYQDIMNMAI